jgi:hypothetical protein
LSRAGPGVALAALAATRVRVESAEWHLRRVVELSEQLGARRAGVDALAADNDPAVVDFCRKAVEGPAVEAALAMGERARAALAELGKWEARGYGE